jgi:aspartate racemase
MRQNRLMHSARSKLIGLIGGMSWESTLPYYRLINQAIGARLGGLHSARILLHSVDFEPIERLQRAGAWDDAGEELARIAASLERAGAELLVLCTNTMHRVADQIEARISIPLLHIADPTAAAIRRDGHATVGLIGTRFTMEEAFYRDRLSQHHGLQVLTPDAAAREALHRIIYDELCRGITLDASREVFRRSIGELVARGAKAVVLGCTEISLLVGPRDADVPLYDTTELHAHAAAQAALAAR